MRAVSIDRGALDHARAVVARSSATPAQENLFRATHFLTRLAFLLFAVWELLLHSQAYHYQRYPLYLGTFAALGSVVLFAINAGVAFRFWRSNRTAKKLGLYWRRAPGLTWSELTLWLVLIPTGVSAIFAGFGGLLVEFDQGDWEEFAGAAFLIVFGICCICTMPMERVRRRVRSILDLRDALDQQQKDSQGPVQLDPGVYDRITDLEFEQKSLDSHESLENAVTGKTNRIVRLSPQFQRALQRMSESDADRVCEVVDGLTTVKRPSPGAGGTATLPVPGTAFRISVKEAPDRSQVEVVSVEAAVDGT